MQALNIMGTMKYLGVVALFLCGIYFLIEGLESFPQKNELIYLEGKISDVGQCNAAIRGRYFQRITLTGIDGTRVEFKRGCADGIERLTERDRNKPAKIHYDKEYIYFLFEETDVFRLTVDGKIYTDYNDRKNNKIAKPLNYFLAILFILLGSFSARKIFNKKSNADA